MTTTALDQALQTLERATSTLSWSKPRKPFVHLMTLRPPSRS